MAGSGINMDAGPLLEGLQGFDDRFEHAVAARLETSALMLQNYAKQNRPWKDQTGHARQRLTCKVSRQGPKKYRLTLAHGVAYGAALEFKHNKKYAIIFPTLERKGPDVMRQFERMMERG